MSRYNIFTVFLCMSSSSGAVKAAVLCLLAALMKTIVQQPVQTVQQPLGTINQSR